MAEEHHSEDYIPLDGKSKEEKYKNAISCFRSLIDENDHPLSTTSNLLALLRQEFNWWWIGFYFLIHTSNG